MIPEERMEFLSDFKDNIRNNWTHDNMGEIAGDQAVPVMPVSLNSEENEDLEMEEWSFEDNRIIGDLSMIGAEGDLYLSKFKEVDEFVRWISSRISEAHQSNR